ncbi:UDP-N-acetylmuramoyl-L-alanine--D-glutamate ligase [Propionibacterium freudenreichii]|uniref:UDP-N-acetylmuramoyl-L-alanine--D-glutamate ligase n=1 Tax=Propionibacterium freudenreichii TaxID=1744 RepID=UPI0024864450|nr:UDP-N-acetylmuramoyl-L-alanine--D-glutamate ligase [Propionibacterium freudenreichii]MDK9293982.1 UDP-N-acetylmuramoyl-L-alanine--D-glutamate ligase [Propionibacterium freudenreichii]MDK9359371.1 UDP-N-acetylmuramoyl-L-alanine--D-glutamate ligase [Propionibacterium freudenreichii]MDK9639346.1 UDP-N-acetylmuramoyl-L-alanine--D-glutamate ligase [Propionibacterium freudenreichii]MDK9658822.1 UDP-N-acetylmuramoyl-L-alanine--D-glutamate ligase [Propionibacterium freudenreichii]WGU91011.1 UDP-N-a
MGVGMVTSVKEWIAGADRTSPWPQAHVVVAGLGTSGFAAADALLELGARVTVIDDVDAEAMHDHARILETLGATLRLGPGSSQHLPSDADVVVTSPGWRPDESLLAAAASRGLAIWGEPELAWRLMHPDRVIPWIGITGTNGKTTTTQMVDSILRAAGHKSAAVGNIGRPIIEAINDPAGYDVLAVELSSFQLHWSDSLSLYSAAALNLHADHLEWYSYAGDTDAAMAAYGADKAKIFHNVRTACVYNVAEPATRTMVEEAEVIEGARAIGFTLGIPKVAEVGVVDDMLVDRAFVQERQTSAMPLAALSDVHPFAPHNVENALAAAALTRSFGVPPRAVAQGLRDLHLGGHRIETVAQSDGIAWVDDSKATNPNAANSSMRAYEHIVWIAGGQTKGTSFDELLTRHAKRLRGVVLLGVDRQVIADALRRHAPQVPVVVLDGNQTGVMDQAVQEASRMARPGDTVLLAPGAASKDMWTGYAARGDDFARAVKRLLASGDA